MKKVKVTVVRQVTETWQFFVDADALDIPSSSRGLTPSEHGDACDALCSLIGQTQADALLDSSLDDSTCQEESIIKWDEVTE